MVSAAGLTGRKSQRFKKVKSIPPTVNFSHTGASDGEKKPSRHPATTNMGMMPETNFVASIPPRAMDSFQRRLPGKSMAWPRRNPAAPAMMMEGSSREPWGATKLQSATDMP